VLIPISAAAEVCVDPYKVAFNLKLFGDPPKKNAIVLMQRPADALEGFIQYVGDDEAISGRIGLSCDLAQLGGEEFQFDSSLMLFVEAWKKSGNSGICEGQAFEIPQGSIARIPQRPIARGEWTEFSARMSLSCSVLKIQLYPARR
jgi:hypothetical protein